MMQGTSLPFNKYSWLTTHNSFSIFGSSPQTGAPIVTFFNQEDSVLDQLNVLTHKSVQLASSERNRMFVVKFRKTNTKQYSLFASRTLCDCTNRFASRIPQLPSNSRQNGLAERSTRVDAGYVRLPERCLALSFLRRTLPRIHRICKLMYCRINENSRVGQNPFRIQCTADGKLDPI